MEFQLAPLPYAKDALAPVISANTVDFHYERHHKGYLGKLQKLIENTPQEAAELEDLIREADGGVYDNAAQVWNHTFYWESLAPDGGGSPRGELADTVSEAFGSPEAFREQLVATGTGLFGSGYVWLTLDETGGPLRLEGLPNADNPLRHGRVPLLAIDVWEHAYYLDHQNQRQRYLEAVADRLISWSAVQDRLDKVR